MSRREIREMLTGRRTRRVRRPWARPAWMAALLVLGIGIGLGIGMFSARKPAPGPTEEKGAEAVPSPAPMPKRQPEFIPPARQQAALPAYEEPVAPDMGAPAPLPSAPAVRGNAEEQAMVAPPVALPPPSGGKPAWIRYAVPAPPAGGRPMIAVVIDDLGLDRRRSERVTTLRAPLTLSYMTYAEELDKQTALAHRRGHELMVHMPMQPLSAAFDPGPQVLKVGLPAEELRRRIDWGLSRFQGFVGVNNHMGSRFTADPAGMRVVMEEMRRRGLLFLDSVTTDKSVAGVMARRYGVPFAAREIFLDNEQSVAAVREQLARVEAVARRRGAAIAIGHPHDVTIEALASWLPSLERRGFVLVPVTALVKAPVPGG